MYNSGMKPITKSLVHDKMWKRSCHGVKYYPSDLRMEGQTRKCYRVLEFKYDFIFPNDSVQFASSLPYTYATLEDFLKSQSSPRVQISSSSSG